MQRALAEYDIRGITTTIGFCKRVTGSAAFRGGHFNTGSIDQFLEEIQRTRTSSETDELVAAASALYFYREDARAVDSPGGDAEGSLWSRQARLEGLR
jgi:acetyl/propionyl-CoA carboxylase alpha subunit